MDFIKIKKKAENNNENDNDNTIKIQIILFILLVICVFVLLIISGIFIGVYLFKKKRRSKYIIDEDFDYTAKNDEVIN